MHLDKKSVQMSDITYHKSLVDFFKIISISNIEINIENIEIPYSAAYIEIINKLNIEYEEISTTRLRLKCSSIQTEVITSIPSFLEKQRKKENYLILENDNIYSYINGNVFINFEPNSDFFLISNHKTYYEFQDFLKSQEQVSDESFHFIDSYSKDLRKLVFVSISEKSRLTIKYELKAPYFDVNIDYSIGFKKFIKCFDSENRSLIKFLKSSTINIVSNYPEDICFQRFFESLNEIVTKANLNFEVYLNELSIDKVKKDYDEVKTKYLSNLSEILAKITNNIILLPIGIATTLFAIEKIKENHTYMALIAIVVFLTSIFMSILIKNYILDIDNNSKILTLDHNLLKENNFFIKYPSELKYFNQVKYRVVTRIDFLKNIIIAYFLMLNLSNSFIIGLILQEYKLMDSMYLYIVIAFISILVLLKKYILEIPEEVNSTTT